MGSAAGLIAIYTFALFAAVLAKSIISSHVDVKHVKSARYMRSEGGDAQGIAYTRTAIDTKGDRQKRQAQAPGGSVPKWATLGWKNHSASMQDLDWPGAYAGDFPAGKCSNGAETGVVPPQGQGESQGDSKGEPQDGDETHDATEPVCWARLPDCCELTLKEQPKEHLVNDWFKFKEAKDPESCELLSKKDGAIRKLSWWCCRDIKKEGRADRRPLTKWQVEAPVPSAWDMHSPQCMKPAGRLDPSGKSDFWYPTYLYLCGQAEDMLCMFADRPDGEHRACKEWQKRTEDTKAVNGYVARTTCKNRIPNSGQGVEFAQNGEEVIACGCRHAGTSPPFEFVPAGDYQKDPFSKGALS